MACAQTRITSGFCEAEAMCGRFGVLLGLELDECVHGLRSRPFHDDVDAATKVRTKDASMASHQLMNFVSGDGVRELVLCQ